MDGDPRQTARTNIEQQDGPDTYDNKSIFKAWNENSLSIFINLLLVFLCP